MADSGVTRLIDALETLAREGDLTIRVDAPEGDDDDARLARALNDSLTRVEEMYRALEAVIVKQRRFVADASHELRTPLTTVSSCLEMVHHFPDMPAEQRRKVIDDALHEAKQMARLVDDLLTLARMDSGERRERAAFEWATLLAPCIDDARTATAPRHVVLDIDAGLGSGAGDVRTLQQLIGILVDNVVRHTPESATVTLAVQRDGEAVRISVCDDGPGVPEAMLEQIFERFVRVDPSRHGAATGLGLAVARAIVADHGGEISARNAAPHGLCVEATLPQVAATADRRRAPRPGRAASTPT